MMTLLLTGADGQLGREIRRAGRRGSSVTVLSCSRSDLDITDPDAIHQALDRQKPDILVNAAAYTAVDQAEGEPDRALAVNRDGPEHLARACARAGIPLIHISTDYVFDGRSRRPYREDDPTAPLNIYGRSKAEGEDRIRACHPEHVILRTSWLYAAHGRNFLTTMIRLGREREALSIVDDQTGSPTHAADLARAVLHVAAALPHTPTPWGTFHCCNAGQTTWFGFAEAIFELASPILGLRPPELIPIPTEDFPTPAERPRFSVLDCTRIAQAFGITPPHWREGLETTLQSLRDEAP